MATAAVAAEREAAAAVINSAPVKVVPTTMFVCRSSIRRVCVAHATLSLCKAGSCCPSHLFLPPNGLTVTPRNREREDDGSLSSSSDPVFFASSCDDCFSLRSLHLSGSCSQLDPGTRELQSVLHLLSERKQLSFLSPLLMQPLLNFCCNFFFA